MKKILILCAMLFGAYAGTAQDETKMMEGLKDPLSINVTETSIKIKKDTRKAQTVYVYADKKDVEKKFISYFQTRYNCEIKKEKDTYYGRTIQMPEFEYVAVDLIGQIEEDERGAKINLAVSTGSDFITESSHPGDAAKLKVILKEFVSDFYVGWYDEVIDAERKDFEKITKDHEKLVKEGEKLQKDLEGQTEKVAKAEDGILKSQQEIAELQNKIAEFRTEIEKLKSEKEELSNEISKNGKETQVLKAEVDKKASGLEKLKTNSDRLKTSN